MHSVTATYFNYLIKIATSNVFICYFCMMRYKLLRGFIFIIGISLVLATRVMGQAPRIIKWQELNQLIQSKSDTTYIINFWATWCAPCVKELPHFVKIAAENENRKLKVILISLDFKSQFETRLVKFVSENKIKPEVLLLDEPDYNSWIDKIDPKWNGSIPGTLIISRASGTRKFYEKEFTYEELSTLINPLIQE